MIDFEKQFGRPDYAIGQRQTQIAATFRIVYGWMCAGLALSGVIAWYTASSGLWQTVLQGPGFMLCIVAELALVFILSLAIGKLPVAVAYLMFIGYAALNGLTLSVVFIAYELALVQRVFFITAGMFGGLALWGTFSKSDLSSVGSVCGMALWGLIIGSIVNLFMKSSGLDWLLTFAGIIIFTGLTMYDARKIRDMAAHESSMDSASLHKAGIMGALALYLDFINLFLCILRFFGRKR
ncbi:MAG: Bax inhibitor-1/YccA family protein [Kiritimatiellae bacterium]|nr:Bax inhibitor-1/YccA family protein [Kiritimatiellia bacterium]